MESQSNCLILYNLPGKDALTDEKDVLQQVEWIAFNLSKLNINYYTFPITKNYHEEIYNISLNHNGYIFNLVESIENMGELIHFIPSLLDSYHLPYTGGSTESIFLTSQKMLAKEIMRHHNLPVPKAFKPSQFDELSPNNTYILKPLWQDGSIGVEDSSVFCSSSKDLRQRCKKLSDKHWFIEEFIDGREFNVSLVTNGINNEPEILPIAEILFKEYPADKPKIVSYRAKWAEDSFEYNNTIREFVDNKLDPGLYRYIETTALKCWEVFQLRGYARIDFRLGNDGELYILEINTNPCISKDSGFVASCLEANYPFEHIVKRITEDLNQ